MSKYIAISAKVRKELKEKTKRLGIKISEMLRNLNILHDNYT